MHGPHAGPIRSPGRAMVTRVRRQFAASGASQPQTDLSFLSDFNFLHLMHLIFLFSRHGYEKLRMEKEKIDDLVMPLLLALEDGAIDEEDLALVCLALDSDEDEEPQPLGPRLDLSDLTYQR